MNRPRPAVTMFSLRPVRTPEEMRAYLQVRFRVYSEARAVSHFKSLDKATGLDLDCFDARAIHLALFAHDDAGNEIVGGLRVVGASSSPQRVLLDAAVASHPALSARLGLAPANTLPMLAYLPHGPEIREQIEGDLSAGHRVAEPSRLTLLQEYRRVGVEGRMTLGSFIVRGALAFGFGVEGLERVYVHCFESLRPFYLSHGFQTMRGGEALPVAALGNEPTTVLSMTPQMIPAHMRSFVAQLERQLRSKGEMAIRASSSVGRVAVEPVAA